MKSLKISFPYSLPENRKPRMVVRAEGLPPGVRLRESGRYDARIKEGGVYRMLGTYSTAEEAAAVRAAALKELEAKPRRRSKPRIVGLPDGMSDADVAIQDLGHFVDGEDALIGSMSGIITAAANRSRPDKPQLIIQALWIAPQSGAAATESDSNG